MKRNLSPELQLIGNTSEDPWNTIPERDIKTFFCPFKKISSATIGIFYILMPESSVEKITTVRQMAFTISGEETIEENIPFVDMNSHHAKLGNITNVQSYIFK